MSSTLQAGAIAIVLACLFILNLKHSLDVVLWSLVV